MLLNGLNHLVLLRFDLFCFALPSESFKKEITSAREIPLPSRNMIKTSSRQSIEVCADDISRRWWWALSEVCFMGRRSNCLFDMKYMGIWIKLFIFIFYFPPSTVEVKSNKFFMTHFNLLFWLFVESILFHCSTFSPMKLILFDFFRASHMNHLCNVCWLFDGGNQLHYHEFFFLIFLSSFFFR